jgi:glycosyltransferase involved in cell wall biosynthesis
MLRTCWQCIYLSIRKLYLRFEKMKASIILLAYNSEEYIGEAIESVLNQNCDDYEIIVGDDCSTDNTIKIVEKYKSIKPEIIKISRSKVNQGITSNFNNCLKECVGQYIFLLGGDDVFLPGKLSAQIEFMDENPEVYISYHDVSVFDSKKDKHLYYYNKDKHGFHAGGLSLLVTQGTFNCGCATAVRNINLPYCDLDIKYASDWLWYMDILARSGKKIDYFEGVYSKYRRHSNNITSKSKIDCQFSEVFISLRKVIERNPTLRNEYFVAYSERMFVFSLKYLIAGDFRGFYACFISIKLYLFGAVYFVRRALLKRVC